MQEIDPITGGAGRRGLVSVTGKAAAGLILIWACVICLGQSARFYVHLVIPLLQVAFGCFYM